MLIEKSRLDTIQKNAINLQRSMEDLKENKISESSFIKEMKVVCTQRKNFQLQVQCRNHIVHIDEPYLNAGGDTAITPGILLKMTIDIFG